MRRIATHAETSFPRIPLLGAGLLLVMTVGIVLASRLASVSTVVPVDIGGLVESRVIIFEEADKQTLVVKDAKTGETIYTTSTGVDGFLRGTLRALGRNRKREGGSKSEPFTISRYESGHIVLTDGVTGAKIDLAAFGPSNAAVFQRFLKSSEKGARP